MNWAGAALKLALRGAVQRNAVTSSNNASSGMDPQRDSVEAAVLVVGAGPTSTLR